MLHPGDVVRLVVEKPAAGGAMIARADGQVVLVAGAIPGEHVTARIERISRGVAHASVVSVQEASADRREPFTDPRCGGSLYAHIAYERQLVLKSQVIADAFARIGRETIDPPPVAASPEHGYRMRARLHVQQGRVGFFREGTHELCDAGHTRQLLPATIEILDRLGAMMRSIRLESIREIDFSENVEASERVMALHAVDPMAARLLDPIVRLEGLTGTVLVTAAGPRTMRGDPHVTEALQVDGAAIRLRRHVLAFFQGNRYLLAGLVGAVLAHVDRRVDVVDLYAGAGLFAVAAASARGAAVTAVEGDRYAAADLQTNAEGSSVECLYESVEAFAARAAASPDATVIVDPPRTGISPEALDGVLRMNARRIVYVSCDVATLARDTRKVRAAGYRIVSIEGFDLFPNTAHVETLVVLER